MVIKKISIYKDIAKEKFMLIILNEQTIYRAQATSIVAFDFLGCRSVCELIPNRRKVYLYYLPFISGEPSLLYKKIATDITHT